MNKPQLTPIDFNQIRKMAKTACGMDLANDKTYLVETRLADLCLEAKVRDYGELICLLQEQKNSHLWKKFIHLLTTHETSWFRDSSLWNVLENKVFMEWKEKIAKGRFLFHTWCAGCSTGQEPYSLAILLEQFCQNHEVMNNARFPILATDISQEVLATARYAVYNDFDIKRGFPLSKQKKYFIRQGANWQLRKEITQKIHFDFVNLIDDFTGKVGPFDLILCRNVIVYLTPEYKKSLLAKIYKVLNPGGYLFVGASESLRGMADQYQACEFQGSFFYRKSQ